MLSTETGSMAARVPEVTDTSGLPRLRAVTSYVLPSVLGAVFGVWLAKAYTELYFTASGWWGAGNVTLGLLVRGPLEFIHLHVAGIGPLPAASAGEAAAIYATFGVLLWQARSSWRRSLVAAAVYISWTAAAILVAIQQGTIHGFGWYVRHEFGGIRGLAEVEPMLFTGFCLSLVAWHGFALWSLARGQI